MSNKYHLISNFNIDPLRGYIINFDQHATVSVAPYGQVIQEVYNNNLDEDSQVVIWASPNSVIPAFAEAQKLNKVNEKECFEDSLCTAKRCINKSIHHLWFHKYR